jgi:hypothetical protein
LKTKTTIYLSIIITSWLVGKIFNPIPLSNYAFYIIVLALFKPYFGWSGTLKIAFGLVTFSIIQDIPFYLSFYQQWPSIANGVFHVVKITDSITVLIPQHNYFHPIIQPWLTNILPHVTNKNINSLIELESNGIVFVILTISGFYLGVANALYALSKAYKKTGIYRRIQL